MSDSWNCTIKSSIGKLYFLFLISLIIWYSDLVYIFVQNILSSIYVCTHNSNYIKIHEKASNCNIHILLSIENLRGYCFLGIIWMLPNTDNYALIDFWWPTYSEKITSKKETSIYEPTNPVRDVLKSRIMNFL